MSTANKSIDVLFSLLGKYDSEKYIGENISQLQHSLQAAYFAKKAKSDDRVVLAALLHDTGHMCAAADAPQMANLGVLHHEDIGAEYLKDLGVDQTICDLVRSHVQGKRYLCFKNQTYFRQLSKASLGTLQFQGGPMSEKEALAFEKHPLFESMILVRKVDEMGKQENLEVPNLESYRQTLLAYTDHRINFK